MVGFTLADMIGGEPLDTADTRMIALQCLFDQVKASLRDCDFDTARLLLASMLREVDQLEDLVSPILPTLGESS